MIISKANLLIGAITGKLGDKRLQNIHITKQGATIAANTRTLIAVSPVTKKVKEQLKFLEEEEQEDESSTITMDTANDVLKYMPKDTQFKGLLEHCGYQGGAFSITDTKRVHSVKAKIYSRDYIDYQKAFSEIGAAKIERKIAINLKTLLHTLKTLDRISQNSTNDQPLYMEITESGDFIFRLKSNKTGQRTVAYTTSYKEDEGEWMKWNLWEKKLMGKLRSLKKLISKKS